MLGNGLLDSNAALLNIHRDAANNDIVASESMHITGAVTQDIRRLVTAAARPRPQTCATTRCLLYLQPNFDGGAAWFDDIEAIVMPEPASTTAVDTELGLIAWIRRHRR